MTEPRIGIYLRLSRDDGADQESMSIANQRSFLTRYVQEKNWTVVEQYVDDGYTGTNFDRPDFQRMLRDIETGKINTVITKDLSRLGRDQIGTLYYFQVWFPSKGIRYIAVNEGIDTAESGTGGITTPFLAAANDFYTADISRKVRTALDTRKKNGRFIGSSAPLGYQKDPQEKGHLLPDSKTAWVVQRIFQEFLSGGSVMGVAKRLTEDGIPTPSASKGTGPTQTRFPGVWSDTMVRRILTNPTYAGHLTQNRRRKIGYKVKRYSNLPEDEWITVKNTHEALVSQEDFDQVQEMLGVRSYCRSGGQEHLLTGLAYCADCGSPMTYVRESPTRTYMVCQGYRKGGRLRLCSSHCIREDRVIEAIRKKLRELAQQLDAESLGQPKGLDTTKRQIGQRIKALERQWEKCKQVGSSLYRDKALGVLTEKEFAELFEENRHQRADLERQLEEGRRQLESKTDQEEWKAQAKKLLAFEALDRGTVLILVEKVLIHSNKVIEIIFRFRKPE